MKYKENHLDRLLEEKYKIEEKQNKLKAKYDIEKENIVIVEKNNIIKFLIKNVVSGGKLICSIILIFLAFVGLLSLIHPEIRNQLEIILKGILSELKTLTSGMKNTEYHTAFSSMVSLFPFME